MAPSMPDPPGTAGSKGASDTRTSGRAMHATWRSEVVNNQVVVVFKIVVNETSGNDHSKSNSGLIIVVVHMELSSSMGTASYPAF